MKLPYELLIGWRYTRAGRATRRNGFISFISAASTLGIALGVWALIVVLSVMNGFQKEVRDRMLSVVSHIEIYEVFGEALPDPAAVMAEARKNPQVAAAAPFVTGQSLLVQGDAMRGVMVRGIEPELEPGVTSMAAVDNAALQKLAPGSFGVVLGQQLAKAMGVQEGDTVTLVAPSGQITPAGVAPSHTLHKEIVMLPDNFLEVLREAAVRHRRYCQGPRQTRRGSTRQNSVGTGRALSRPAGGVPPRRRHCHARPRRITPLHITPPLTDPPLWQTP